MKLSLIHISEPTRQADAGLGALGARREELFILRLVELNDE